MLYILIILLLWQLIPKDPGKADRLKVYLDRLAAQPTLDDALDELEILRTHNDLSRSESRYLQDTLELCAWDIWGTNNPVLSLRQQAEKEVDGYLAYLPQSKALSEP